MGSCLDPKPKALKPSPEAVVAGESQQGPAKQPPGAFDADTFGFSGCRQFRSQAVRVWGVLGLGVKMCWVFWRRRDRIFGGFPGGFGDLGLRGSGLGVQ